ncbi:hypothetical protein OHD16_10630 [Sphingobacterium sp. ML3W]|uniref:hypothetical protein n=1 Tax=Sphingobacterium sp. ML3W TaxID=1538644 RepID=UPI00249C9ED0|nr:hypothetical protein [Sphingobacterium sp. ML3W]WFA80416.1 hypothetical protein OGI71_03775 [Sphingobacterium sp. ML3W]
MKKILNKIGQVLQVVLLAPVKLPSKAANIVKYIALGLGILETVIEEDKPPPQGIDQPDGNADPSDSAMEERSEADETQ